jgi:cell division transport system permease protein
MKTTWKHIRRSPYQSIAAIFTVFLIFIAISMFSFIVVGASVTISHFESMPQVTAFFKEEAKQTEIDSLQQTLRATGKISKMQFVSKDQAFQRFKDQNKSDPLLLELVNRDILPASLEISTYELEDLSGVSDTLQHSPLVESVAYPKQVVSALIPWTNAIRVIGIVLILILSLVSVFVVMTVIGFKVSQKREEIEIMKLLSANNWYIRGPFILEGIIYGIIGTFFGWLISSISLFYATPYLETLLKGIPLLPVSPMFLISVLFGEILIAVILCIFASALAVLRYLK